ncbi:ATP-binding cassette domain-containing protein [uncultured Alistipes sp.]|uniref:ATP-binding cassette domain-containing protein n=1 Tax=uncultured Alistipes sp. TaxID=538949 RepID=UPI00280553C7|nr:ATP-binding cassette domain-containing protein [uncultured Alistipes sp.]
MITADNLTVRLGRRDILSRLNMHLTEGAIHGIVGINGAGKTTLLRTLYGLLRPTSGSVTRNGRPLNRREMALLETEPAFYEGMTGRDLLDLTAHYHPSSDPEPYLRLFALPADEPVDNWSTGMKRKLALSSVLMQRKEVVLLDEPFNGLDMESLYVTRQLLSRRRAEGATLVVTSHLMEPLAELCDDLFVLDGAAIAARYDRREFPRAVRELEVIFRRRYEAEFAEK